MLIELNKKILEARKGGDKFSAGVLNLVKAELQNNEKSEKSKPELEVVKSYAKKLQKSLSMFEGSDKYEEMHKEVELVKTLLPPELSENDIQAAVNKYLADNPSESNMGKIIGALKSQLPEADGSTLAKVVKTTLTSSN